MTTPETITPPARRIPGFAVVLGIGILFVGGLLSLMLFKPPQKNLCDEAAPAISLPLFPEYKGNLSADTVTLSDLKGKGVVLNFWASWCKPCEEEAAELHIGKNRNGIANVVIPCTFVPGLASYKLRVPYSKLGIVFE